MRRSALAILFISFALIGIGIALFGYYAVYLLEHQEVGYDFTVKNEVGIVGDHDILHLGGVPPGGKGARSITVTPARDSRLVVRFSGTGTDYLFVDRNDILVTAGEPVALTFSAEPPADAPLGNYSGTVDFFFYRR